MKKSNTGLRGISKRPNGKFETRVNITHRKQTNSYYVGIYSTIDKAVEARQQFITNLF